MIVTIIQNGDVSQVSDNGIPGWDYIFGIQDNAVRKKYPLASDRYRCQGTLSNGETSGARIWCINDTDTTSFRLSLIY